MKDKKILIQGNMPLLLTGPKNSYFVSKGSIDLFFTETKDGKALGKRKYFFTAGEGDLILGLDPKTLGGYSFILTGAHGSEVKELDTSKLMDSFVKGENLDKLDRFLVNISNFAPVGHSIERVPMDTKLNMKKGALFRSASEVGWVEVKKGATNFSNSFKGLFPVTSKSYLFSSEDSEIIVHSTKKMAKDIKKHLYPYLEFMLSNYISGFEMMKKNSVSTFRSRLSRTNDRMKATLRSLVSLFFPGDHTDLLDLKGDPHVVAAKAIGLRENINVVEPKYMGDAYRKDPISEIARVSKFMTRKVILTGNWWERDMDSLFCYLTKGNDLIPVAILVQNFGDIFLFNPADKSMERLDENLASRIHFEAYQFYRPFPNKKLNIYDLLSFGIRKKNYKDLFFILGIGFITGLLGMVVPILTGKIFNTVIPEAEYGSLLHITIFLVAISISTAMFQVAKSVAMLRFEGWVDLNLESAIWSRLMSLPVPFFNKFSAGDLSVRANSIIKMRQMLTGAAMSTVLAAIFSIFQFFLLFYYSTKMALVALLLTIVPVILTLISGNITIKYLRELAKLQGKMSGLTFQIVSGISKFRITGGESRAFSVWAKHVAQKDHLEYSSGVISNYLSVFSSFYPIFSSAILFYFYTKVPNMAVGSFLAFQAAFGSFLSAILSLASVYVSIQRVVPLYERAKPILESIPEVTEQKRDPGEIDGSIGINNISFRYGDTGPLILKDVSISIGGGEFVAFVGSSGSGKSTLMRLLLGFEKAEEGNIYYDDHNIKDLDIQAVRRKLGVVLQNGKLMSGDIYSNIIGPHNIGINEAWEAAKAAGLDKDIEQMPMGMHTVVGDAGTLSGGQKQRLLIARALVNRPRVLFFDEATSALDNRTQQIVSESLDRLQATKIVVAHRLSTIMGADKIYVFDGGSIVESGNYQELMKKDGLFAQLAKRQIA